MKSSILIIIFSFISLISFAQDVITYKTGKTEECKISQVTDSEITFQKLNSTTVYSVPKSQILSVKFQDSKTDLTKNKSKTEEPKKSTQIIATDLTNKKPFKKSKSDNSVQETKITLVEKPKTLEHHNKSSQNTTSIKYKGYVEIGYANSPVQVNYGSNNTKIKAVDVLTGSTSHGILISDAFFVGLGGQYLKTLSSGGSSGFIGHADIRYSVLNNPNFRLNIGSKAGYLKYSLIENVNQGIDNTGVLTTTGGLMINPFVSGEIRISQGNNLIVSAGYLSQKYNVRYDKSFGKGSSTLFNNDFEYFNFSVGISF